MSLSVSQTISESFQMLRGRFGGMLGLYLVFFVIQTVLFMVMGSVFMGVMAAGAGAEVPGPGAFLGLFVAYIVYFLIAFAQSASLTHQASPLQNPSLGDSLSAGVRSALPLLGVTILMVIAYFAISIGISLVVGLLSFASSSLGSVVSLLVAAVLLIAVIYAFCRLMIVTQVVAIDRVTNPIRALQRAWSLTRGYALPIFVITLAISVISVVIFLLLAAPLISTFVAAGSTGSPPDIAAIGSLGAFAVIGLVVAFVVLSLLWAAVGAAIHAALNRHMGSGTPDVFS
jgi:hypothetical protein